MNFQDALKKAKPNLFLVAGASQKKDYAKVDLSEAGLKKVGVNPAQAQELEKYLSSCKAKAQAKILYGGYLEKRNLYATTERFNQEEVRNIHLGIDYWADANTPIKAPLAGIVTAAHYNEGEGNYGGTIILMHQVDRFLFYSLYGHLSKESLKIPIGKSVEKDALFCALGDVHENGNYVPHLHFQWILSLPVGATDYPGVCAENQIEIFAKNSPQPSL